MIEAETKLHLPQIEAFARCFYAGLDFAHNQEHGERVVANALTLQSQEGGSQATVIAGAWLHQFHDNLNELSLGLEKIGLPENAQNRLFEIVEACRPQRISKSASLEARIVFDADALDLIGPFGTIREVLCNFNHRKMAWQDSVNSCQQVQALFTEKLQTESARQIASERIKVNADFWRVYQGEINLSTLGYL